MAGSHENFLSGITKTDSPLGSGATTLNSDGLASMAAIAAPTTAYIVLDPQAVYGAPEIVKVTAHTGSATSVTITRAQLGTSARSHVLGTQWVQSLLATEVPYLDAANTFTATANSFGAGAAGGSGTYAEIGSESDASNVYFIAKGSGTDVGIIQRLKGIGAFAVQSGSTAFLTVDANGSIFPWRQASGTADQVGFFFVRFMAGAPVGVPTTVPGCVPITYDTTSHKLWVYDGGWKGVVVA